MLLTRFQKEGKCRIFYVYNLGVLLHGKKSTLPRVVKDSPKYGYFDGGILETPGLCATYLVNFFTPK